MKKKSFNELNRDFQILLSTLPMSVYCTRNPDDETSEQLIATRDRFLKLPEPTKDKLSSLETSEKIKKIGEVFGLQLLQTASIARAVRGYYFGEIKLEDFPNILAKEIPVDTNVAGQISKQVIEKIINDNSLGENKNLIALSLAQALKQFPNLGEQLISSSGIKMRYFSTPVRPSIKNWIADYNEVVGVSDHDMMKRGDYLFHNENGKRLTPGERQKVAEILKSFDDGSMLSIDSQKQEVVFNFSSQETVIGNHEMRNNVQQPPVSGKLAVAKPILDQESEEKINNFFSAQEFVNRKENDQKLAVRTSQPVVVNNQQPISNPQKQANINFSSPHKFPSENNNDGKNLPKREFRNDNFIITPHSDDPRINGNVVDLRN